jgi:hypothetical protein
MKYNVIFEKFTERHFIKTYTKKYKGAWNTTLKGLIVEFTFCDSLFQKNIAETISDSSEIKICKTEFKIAGTQESRHGSGHRCIVAIHKKEYLVSVLLVYSKTDISGNHETNWWKNLIKENYSEYRNLL